MSALDSSLYFTGSQTVASVFRDLGGVRAASQKRYPPDWNLLDNPFAKDYSYFYLFSTFRKICNIFYSKGLGASTMEPAKNNPLDIFIEGWGMMAGAWGISKVMAEIYALLYLCNRPLSLEEMSEKLKTSRSNISLNVRSLQDLGVVRKVIIRGDRKDYYQAEEDIVKVAKRLATEKKKRELGPAIEIVEKAIHAADSQPGGGSSEDDSFVFYAERLKAFLSLMIIVEGVFDSFIDSASNETPPLEAFKTQNL